MWKSSDLLSLRHDVLHWVIPRQEPIRALNTDQLGPSHDLEADEIKFLTLVAGSGLSADEQQKSDKFWAIAALICPLADWGHHVVNWLHACPCPKPCSSTSKSKAARSKQCPLKGRRAIQMACGQMADFIAQLNAVGINPRAQEFMRGLGADVRNTLLTEFNLAKSCMQLRMSQSFSFWEQRPWRFLRIAECLTVEGGPALERSRQEARALLDNPSSPAAISVIEANFTMRGSSLRSDLEVFAHGGSMGIHLRRELLSYGTSLLVLQGLESRHHLVALKVGRGRAASVPAVSAEIRRMQNRDLHNPRFQSMLPDLLVGISSLTSLPYENQTQLINNIMGQVYRGLHADLSSQADYFARFRKHLQFAQSTAAARVRPRDYDMMMAHLKESLQHAGFYAIPHSQGHHLVFQLLSTNPGQRMYLQRAAHMGTDESRPRLTDL